MNDNPPEFASHTYSTTIPESARVNTDDTGVTRVFANSRDIGRNAEITYSIIGGNEHRKFAIHPKTGQCYSEENTLFRIICREIHWSAHKLFGQTL